MIRMDLTLLLIVLSLALLALGSTALGVFWLSSEGPYDRGNTFFAVWPLTQLLVGVLGTAALVSAARPVVVVAYWVVSALVFFGLLFLFLLPAPGALGVGALLAVNWVAIQAGYHLLQSRPSPGSSRTGSRRPAP